MVLKRTRKFLSVLARSRTWSTTFAESRASPAHSKDELFSSPPRNRTPSCRIEVCRAIQHTRRPCFQYPDLESNQDQDLRRVLCYPLHHRDTRADDWIRTSIIPLTKRAPFSVEPRRQVKAGVQGVEPCLAVLEAACFPEAHSCNSAFVVKGDRWELNPHLLLHRQTCLPRTPRKIGRAHV